MADHATPFCPRDLIDAMERPFATLQKARRTAPMSYVSPNGDVRVRLLAQPQYGLANIWDHDILIYLVSQVAAQPRLPDGSPDPVVRTTYHHLLRSIRRGVSSKEYLGLKAGLDRLKSMQIETTIRSKSPTDFARLSFVESWGGNGPSLEDPHSVWIRLGAWVCQAISDRRILAIDPAYFDITSATERALYRVARKHAGYQAQGFLIGAATLRSKIGSETGQAAFTRKLAAIALRNPLPVYSMTIQRLGNGEPAVHFLHRAREHTPEVTLAQSPRAARDAARTAWIDGQRDPRGFEEAWDHWRASRRSLDDFLTDHGL